MSPRPEEYLETLMSRQADLILESHWDRLLRPSRERKTAQPRLFRSYVAARLRWLADRLQAEPDLLPAAG